MNVKKFAKKVYNNQQARDGRDLYEHCAEVAKFVKNFNTKDHTFQTVAFLLHVPSIYGEDIKKQFDIASYDTWKLLRQPLSETRLEYLNRIKESDNEVARLVLLSEYVVYHHYSSDPERWRAGLLTLSQSEIERTMTEAGYEYE